MVLREDPAPVPSEVLQGPQTKRMAALAKPLNESQDVWRTSKASIGSRAFLAVYAVRVLQRYIHNFIWDCSSIAGVIYAGSYEADVVKPLM